MPVTNSSQWMVFCGTAKAHFCFPYSPIVFFLCFQLQYVATTSLSQPPQQRSGHRRTASKSGVTARPRPSWKCGAARTSRRAWRAPPPTELCTLRSPRCWSARATCERPNSARTASRGWKPISGSSSKARGRRGHWRASIVLHFISVLPLKLLTTGSVTVLAEERNRSASSLSSLCRCLAASTWQSQILRPTTLPTVQVRWHIFSMLQTFVPRFISLFNYICEYVEIALTCIWCILYLTQKPEAVRHTVVEPCGRSICSWTHKRGHSWTEGLCWLSVASV